MAQPASILEHRTVVMGAAVPCASYAFTASSSDEFAARRPG
jgi:hypothetical protein